MLTFLSLIVFKKKSSIVVGKSIEDFRPMALSYNESNNTRGGTYCCDNPPPCCKEQPGSSTTGG